MSPSAAADVEDGLGELAADLAAASLAMARRFARGATMWCVSPTWPHHARHVAVEFVHPVIVGKPALPALLADAHDPVGAVRVSARPGDLVVAIAAADDSDIRDLVRRAPAWGVETVWVGQGQRPPPGTADHVLWLDDAAHAPFDGRFILLYHLLWELTHVCLEQPAVLVAPEDGTDEVCITCSDEGRLAEVMRAGDADEALVRTADGRQTVDTTLVGPVAARDLVLIHAGSAIAKVDSES